MKLRLPLASRLHLGYTRLVQTNRYPPVMMERSSLPGIAESRRLVRSR